MTILHRKLHSLISDQHTTYSGQNCSSSGSYGTPVLQDRTFSHSPIACVIMQDITSVLAQTRAIIIPIISCFRERWMRLQPPACHYCTPCYLYLKIAVTPASAFPFPSRPHSTSPLLHKQNPSLREAEQQHALRRNSTKRDRRPFPPGFPYHPMLLALKEWVSTSYRRIDSSGT